MLSLPLPVVLQRCLLPRVSAVVSRRLPATPCSVLRAAVLARGLAAPQRAVTVAMLPNGTESRMSDGDDAGDCPEVCGCQSPESECVPSLLRCLQSLPGVSALIVLRLSKSSLRVLANDMLAASAACAANQAVNTVVIDAATAGVSAAATIGVCLEPEHDENANDPALPQRGRHLVPTRACPGPDGGRPGATPWRPPGGPA